jgi:putative DNA primase/helicase
VGPLPGDHAGRSAGHYLTSRIGISRHPDALRYAPDERYAEAGTKPSWHPAMAAKADPSDEAATRGERAAIQRTYLNEFGEKAAVTTSRKMMGAMLTARPCDSGPL